MSRTATKPAKAAVAPTGAHADEIDAYLAKLPADKRAALEALRRTIRASAPEALEGLSYQIPTFRYRGGLVSFGAASKHCAFYVMSPAVMEAHRDELAGYDTTKGAIRFSADQPLPAALVKKLVVARMKENRARGSR